MGIDDAALLLDGMAFTEVMSVEFPFFEMVQWTSDFVTTELRSHWTEDEWRKFASKQGIFQGFLFVPLGKKLPVKQKTFL